MPVVSTEAMSLFLGRVSHQLAADEYAVMVLDRAGWLASTICTYRPTSH